MNSEPLLTITLTESQYQDTRQAISSQITHWLLLSTDASFKNTAGAKVMVHDLEIIRDHFDVHYRKSMMLRGVKTN